MYDSCTACLSDPYCGWCASASSTATDRDAGTCMDVSASDVAESCAAWLRLPFPSGMPAADVTVLAQQHKSTLTAACLAGGLDNVRIAPRPWLQPRPPTPPQVHNVWPRSGPVFGETRVTVTGAFFGQAPEAMRVWLGQLPCKDVTLHSQSVLSCTTTPAAVTRLQRYPLRVARGSLRSPPGGLNATFTMWPATVRLVQPAAGPTTGGIVLNITGEMLGTERVKPTIFIGGRPCLRTQLLSNTSVQCVLAPGSGVALDVEYRVGNHTSMGGQQTFSYFDPEVLAVVPPHGPTMGGTEVHIVGRDFGERASSIAVFIGEVPCAAVERVSSSEIRCVVPAGVGHSHTAVVRLQASLPLRPARAGARTMLRTPPNADATFSFDGASFRVGSPARAASSLTCPCLCLQHRL